MEQLDAKVFALITVGTAFVISILKKAIPKIADNKEEVWAGILPVLFVVIAKFAGAFKVTSWVDALMWAIGAAVTAGVSHDYAGKPFFQWIFGKKKAADEVVAPPAPPAPPAEPKV